MYPRRVLSHPFPASADLPTDAGAGILSADPKWGPNMSVLVVAVFASVMMLAASPQAPALALTPQQQLMKTCNTEAGSQKLAGDARKTFMSDCLSGKTLTPLGGKTLTPQQELMKTCNVQASTQKLKGDPRKQFLSTCLKG